MNSGSLNTALVFKYLIQFQNENEDYFKQVTKK